MVWYTSGRIYLYCLYIAGYVQSITTTWSMYNNSSIIIHPNPGKNQSMISTKITQCKQTLSLFSQIINLYQIWFACWATAFIKWSELIYLDGFFNYSELIIFPLVFILKFVFTCFFVFEFMTTCGMDDSVQRLHSLGFIILLLYA